MRLHRLLGEVPACPVCDDQPCEHEFQRGLYRIGDGKDVYDEAKFGPKPKPVKRKKGRRMKRGPDEDRMHRLSEDRSR